MWSLPDAAQNILSALHRYLFFSYMQQQKKMHMHKLDRQREQKLLTRQVKSTRLSKHSTPTIIIFTTQWHTNPLVHSAYRKLVNDNFNVYHNISQNVKYRQTVKITADNNTVTLIKTSDPSEKDNTQKLKKLQSEGIADCNRLSIQFNIYSPAYCLFQQQ